ncbi:MAG: hypothetical protein Q4F10_06160 [Corynebacterium glutamicum]|nr:hypothetical protein [Corynebacterium glutamicum]
MADLTTLTETDLHAGYRAYAQEIERRHELRRIPEQITELATQGRQVGVTDEVMINAVTHVPEPDPEQAPE